MTPGSATPIKASVEAHRLLYRLYENGARAVLTPKAIRVLTPRGGHYRLDARGKAAVRRNSAGVKALLEWDAAEAEQLRRHAGYRVQGVSVYEEGELFLDYDYSLCEIDEAIRGEDMGLVRYYCWRALAVAAEIRGQDCVEPPPSTGMQPALVGGER